MRPIQRLVPLFAQPGILGNGEHPMVSLDWTEKVWIVVAAVGFLLLIISIIALVLGT